MKKEPGFCNKAMLLDCIKTALLPPIIESPNRYDSFLTLLSFQKGCWTSYPPISPCPYDLLPHHYQICVVHIAMVTLHVLVACGLPFIAL